MSEHKVLSSPPQPDPVPERNATDSSGCNVSKTKSAWFVNSPLREARSTLASVGPSTAAAIRSGSDIRNATEVAHHP